MHDFRSGQIVLPARLVQLNMAGGLNFPFVESNVVKKRPAPILLDTQDGDVIVSRITSQDAKSDFDVEITHWQKAGLLLPSIARIHKIATIEKKLIPVRRILWKCSLENPKDPLEKNPPRRIVKNKMGIHAFGISRFVISAFLMTNLG